MNKQSMHQASTCQKSENESYQICLCEIDTKKIVQNTYEYVI